ncbi:uncharacterized protein KY384_006121 [Bacidia gigantensis]|uniref:uncharacterized protein n=1 Tax=Bacidia gigantensis TaxID=2732470 RepID=UPI001D039FAC|nr:uncharacterized protein KY384_006121 [Bacidia gigantensis]KAG8529484.1 hypothetical protein KY384_006121 [Bacidia gigantensis]
MGAPRRKPLIKSRRVVEDEGEEEEGSAAAAVEEDSLSEGSIISDADDDADGEGSDESELDASREEVIRPTPLQNGHHEKSEQVAPEQAPDATGTALLNTSKDTEAMMNGLKISDNAETEGVDFDDLAQHQREESGISHQESAIDRRRREHEEYRKKRDADPAFVPNRGGFFMHDHRSAGPGQNGFRPFGRGQMRGRGAFRGPFQESRVTQYSGPADAPWAHDLHDSVTKPDTTQSNIQSAGPDKASNTSYGQLTAASPGPSGPPNRTFSTTTRLGEVQVRILLQGMSESKIISGVSRNSHTRLPQHRPPLRRDKPVRVSIPHMQIKFIFPAMDRSFIFIPRALRPHQQGFGRPRARGSFGPGIIGFDPLSSKRTSAYGGSAYSPSIALSRRSSLAREVSFPGMTPPNPLNLPQQSTMILDASKPVVRLPPASEQQQQVAGGSPSVTLPQLPAHLEQQRPAFQENRTEDLPMHHPKPERSLQVAGIESPAVMEFNPPAVQQQPFHQQMPMQMAPQAMPMGALQPQHSRHPSHPSHTSGGTPLPQIPEAAIHAQPFQPYPFAPPQHFYPQPYQPQMYYYPPSEQGGGSPAAAPPFVPGQQYFYPMPMMPPPPPPPPPPQASQQTEPVPQSGTVAHEAGGMVYYYDPSELAASTEASAGYSTMYVTAPPATTMEGVMPPPFYPPPQAFYPPQQ